MKANGTTVGSSPSKSGVMMIDVNSVDSEQDHMIVDYNHMVIDYRHDDLSIYLMSILFITISNHPSTIDHSSEAGMLLVGIEPFDTTLFDGYVPMGHRGDMLFVMGICHHIFIHPLIVIHPVDNRPWRIVHCRQS